MLNNTTADALVASFKSIREMHKQATLDRLEVQRNLAEAVQQARDCEQQYTLRKARISGDVPGKNAEQRAATLLVMLEEDEVYTTIFSEAYEHRARASELEAHVRVKDEEVRALREELHLIANLAGQLQ